MLGCTGIALVFFNAIRGVTVNNKMTLSLKGTVHNVGLLAAGFDRERKTVKWWKFPVCQFRVTPALKECKSCEIFQHAVQIRAILLGRQLISPEFQCVSFDWKLYRRLFSLFQKHYLSHLFRIFVYFICIRFTGILCNSDFTLFSTLRQHTVYSNELIVNRSNRCCQNKMNVQIYIHATTWTT